MARTSGGRLSTCLRRNEYGTRNLSTSSRTLTPLMCAPHMASESAGAARPNTNGRNQSSAKSAGAKCTTSASSRHGSLGICNAKNSKCSRGMPRAHARTRLHSAPLTAVACASAYSRAMSAIRARMLRSVLALAWPPVSSSAIFFTNCLMRRGRSSSFTACATQHAQSAAAHQPAESPPQTFSTSGRPNT